LVVLVARGLICGLLVLVVVVVGVLVLVLLRVMRSITEE